MSEEEKDFSNGVAREAKEQLLRTGQHYGRLSVTVVALAGLAVVASSSITIMVGLGNRRLQERTKDCTEPSGKCYQQTQAATAAAVQSVLDYIDDSMGPHRLRNEAENSCQVELFAGDPSFAAKGVQPALDFYNACVLRRSGNTAPPAVPPNPLTSTTTTR